MHIRITFVSSHFAQYVRTIADALQSYDVNCILNEKNCADELANHERRPADLYLSFSNADRIYNFIRDIISFIRFRWKFRPDIFHFQETENDTLFIIWLLSLGSSRVLTIHDVDPHPGTRRSLRGYIYVFIMRRFSSVLVLHSESLRRKVQEKPYMKRKSTLVVPHVAFSSSSEIKPSEKRNEERPLTFALVGRLNAYKGCGVFLRALEILNSYGLDYRAIIAGTGPEEKWVSKEADKNPLIQPTLRYLTPDEIDHIVTHSDVIVLPYLEASASGILAQAIGVGTPTIATSVGSFPEYIKHGSTGWLVEPNKPEALASAMKAIIDRPSMLSIATSNLRLHARQFDAKIIALQLRSLYSDLLA